ncbi:MAG: efflux transporter outer membrane subunit [Candidatus Omnitrophota bacterium]
MKRIFIIILGIIFLNGCTMAPKYDRPGSPISKDWPKGEAYPKAQPAANVVDATQLKWREFFIDPKLQQVIQMALANNRDLRLAVLNVERARALYGVQRAELLPVLDATGALAKQRYSRDFAGYPEQYSADLGITSWEIDFFGRIRSLTKQALEEYLSTEETRRSAQIALISEVARAYLTIAKAQTDLSLARSTLKAQEDSYILVLRRYKASLVSEIDLQRAQTQVDTAKGDVILYTQRIAEDVNALDLLAGAPVAKNLLPDNLESVALFKDIFPGLSSEVLLKRPDVLAAEHELKGAYANIGAARAAFFPSISLTTALGSASSAFTNLFSAGRGTWIYSPQITMPIFDMRTWATYRVSRADQKIALVKYEKTIQAAFREVADILAIQGTVDAQIAVQQSMVDSAQKVYSLSQKRYDNGIDSYLSVLDAQRSLYRAQKELILMQLYKLSNQVQAYAALGGGGLEESPGQRLSSRDAFEEKILLALSVVGKE